MLHGTKLKMRMKLLHDELGVEVTGIDLSQGVPTEELERALHQHIVVVVRAQSLSPKKYVAVMSALGTPARQNNVDELLPGYPEIIEIDSRTAKLDKSGQRNLFGTKYWHTDHTNQQCPPKITALYAKMLPPSGGDTCFANAYLLYERLAAERRTAIAVLRTVNGADRHLDIQQQDPTAFAQAAIHPLVRKHPVTGRHALYVHPLKALHIEGWGEPESLAFFEELLEEAVRPELVYRHQWRLGDLVLIDNRACLHRAMIDYDADAGRVMHRIILEGDRPIH